MIVTQGPVQARKENALAMYSFISGYFGAFFLIYVSYLFSRLNVRENGLTIYSVQIAENFTGSAIFALGVCGLAMLFIEFAIRVRLEKKIIAISEKLTQRQFGRFFAECLLNYALDLSILWMAVFFYQHASEFGFTRKAPFYQPWFLLMDILWHAYLFGGLPYILLTRAFQHDPDADRKAPAYLLFKLLMRLARKTPFPGLFRKLEFLDFHKDAEFSRFTQSDKTSLLGIFVKMFFLPLMTVFFADQFEHVISNWSYIFDTLSKTFSTSFVSATDLLNIFYSVIFSVDVGLAWCGYLIATRWIRNGNVSVEPTFLGWFVAVSCYPPFKYSLFTYFSGPNERAYLSIPLPSLVMFFTVISLASYCVYVLATIYFGLRFSNLTHRGIIRRGPYAFVRHPAYASKNFSWWCVSMPTILFESVSHRSLYFLIQIIGLCLMSYFYYWRAITEERHLRADPEYLEYCKQVPYRFIPGIL